eukprot:scaffold15750_cov110-Isochrysis_galbana.AAC.5
MKASSSFGLITRRSHARSALAAAPSPPPPPTPASPAPPNPLDVLKHSTPYSLRERERALQSARNRHSRAMDEAPSRVRVARYTSRQMASISSWRVLHTMLRTTPTHAFRGDSSGSSSRSGEASIKARATSTTREQQRRVSAHRGDAGVAQHGDGRKACGMLEPRRTCVGPTECEDTLICISDGCDDCVPTRGEQLQQSELRLGSILRLVQEDVRETWGSG